MKEQNNVINKAKSKPTGELARDDELNQIQTGQKRALLHMGMWGVKKTIATLLLLGVIVFAAIFINGMMVHNQTGLDEVDNTIFN